MAARLNENGMWEWYEDGIPVQNGITTVSTAGLSGYSYVPTTPITPPDIVPTYIASPEEVSLTVIQNILKQKGIPDVTINGYSISGLIQAHAITCVDSLRRGTVAHIQKLEAEKTKLREKLLLSGESTDPISGRKFREEE